MSHNSLLIKIKDTKLIMIAYQMLLFFVIYYSMLLVANKDKKLWQALKKEQVKMVILLTV